MDLVTVERESGLKFTIGLRDHQITTDMSVDEGGADAGCNPVELMAASLGGCLAIMVQRYCTERGYTDGDVGVSLTAELADNPKRVTGFVVDVELPEDVPESEREKLKQVVRQFPVPATLREAPDVMVEFT
ncbi:MAG: OsmC family protein [Longimicrobiales bacterium]